MKREAHPALLRKTLTLTIGHRAMPCAVPHRRPRQATAVRQRATAEAQRGDSDAMPCDPPGDIGQPAAHLRAMRRELALNLGQSGAIATTGVWRKTAPAPGRREAPRRVRKRAHRHATRPDPQPEAIRTGQLDSQMGVKANGVTLITVWYATTCRRAGLLRQRAVPDRRRSSDGARLAPSGQGNRGRRMRKIDQG